MVTVIIVNWNAGSQLQECVLSVTNHGAAFVSRIIVIDNGSNDGSESTVEGLANVTVIRAGANLGFGKACNRAAAYVQDEYLLFLNPDARLFSNSLAEVVGYLEREANAKVGICGVQLIDEDGHIGRNCARFPTAAKFVAHASGIDRVFATQGHFMSEWDHSTTREVDHVIGAFFFVRRRVFDAIKGFDERFFLYLEDLDFSFRAMQRGWASAYVAEAQVFHAGGGTSRQVKDKRLFYSLRSRILYAFKHFSFVGALMVVLTTLFVEPVSRTILAASRASWSSVKETNAAYGMLFRWLPRWIINGTTR